MKNESYTNVKLDNLEIKIVPTDILGDRITYKVEFKANDWGEQVPNISCLATKITINNEEYKLNLDTAQDPVESVDPEKKENKKETKEPKKDENKK